MAKKKSTTVSQSSGNDTALTEKFLRQAQPYMAVLNEEVTTDEQKANHLRAYHQLGALSRKLSQHHKGYGRGVLKQHAKALKQSYSFLSLAGRFAERYSEKELDRLCRQPLEISHLRALADIEDKKQRAALQKQAYVEKLSVAALFARKQRTIAPKRSGGATIKVAKNPQTAVDNLLSDGEAWVRRCKATIKSLNSVKADDVTAELQTTCNDSIPRLKAVAKAAKDAQKALERLVSTS